MRKSRGQLEREEKKKYFGLPVTNNRSGFNGVQLVLNPESMKAQRKRK